MKILIIGNGAAGVTAAKHLREKSGGAEITVVTDEKFHYYNRPALIDLLAGRKRESELYFHPDAWYAENKIKVLLEKTAEKIDLAAKTVDLDDGSKIPFEKLLIAAGARSNLPPIKGSDNAGVFTLRCLEDAQNLLSAAKNARKIVVIGGGILGLEAAAALKRDGAKITVIETAPYLLPRQLDKKGGEILAGILAKRGIDTIAGAKTEFIENAGGEAGQNTASADRESRAALTVKLAGGKVIPSDLVLISAGVRSNAEIAKNAGISVGRGITVNEYLETSAPDVYAAGDAAEFNGVVRGIVPAAIEQARVAAQNIASPRSAKYSGTVMSNTLKVAGLDLTTEGSISTDDGVRTLEKTDHAKNIYKKIFIKDNKIAGFISLGDKKNVREISAALKSKKTVTPDEAEKLIQ